MSIKYLDYIPKTLQDDFINNRVVPFVGAGFSRNAEIPKDAKMADWEGLGRKVAEYLPEYTYTNSIDALSLFEREFSRTKMIEVMATELHIHQIKPGEAHRSFCRMNFDTICTTNFDFLLERALDEINKAYSLIVTEDRLPINMQDTTKLLKVHGDFNHPERMVITEDDFDSFIDNNKVLSTYISNLFITRTLLLIGYSFEDNDIRMLWKMIGSRLGKLQTPAYVILVGASPTEISRFERRGVRVINLPGAQTDYPKILEDFFVQMKEMIEEKNKERMVATNEKALEELKMPQEEKKLCFVSAPYQRLSFLKELLYPILKNKHISPLTCDEIIMPGEMISRKIDAIISSASMAIVDVTEDDQFVRWQLSSALNKKIPIILIGDQEQPVVVPYILKDQKRFEYSLLGGNKDFANNIAKELDTLYHKQDKSDDKPDYRRLLDKGECTAAVIMVFRHLENRISNMNINLQNEPSIYQLKPNNTKAKKKLSLMKEYRYIRNLVVHTPKTVDKEKAEDIINYVEDICHLIEEGDITI